MIIIYIVAFQSLSLFFFVEVPKLEDTLVESMHAFVMSSCHIDRMRVWTRMRVSGVCISAGQTYHTPDFMICGLRKRDPKIRTNFLYL